jgi:hypothetical protein
MREVQRIAERERLAREERERLMAVRTFLSHSVLILAEYC